MGSPALCSLPPLPTTPHGLGLGKDEWLRVWILQGPLKSRGVGCWGPCSGINLSMTLLNPTVFPASHSHVLLPTQVRCFSRCGASCCRPLLSELRVPPSSSVCSLLCWLLLTAHLDMHVLHLLQSFSLHSMGLHVPLSSSFGVGVGAGGDAGSCTLWKEEGAFFQLCAFLMILRRANAQTGPGRLRKKPGNQPIV